MTRAEQIRSITKEVIANVMAEVAKDQAERRGPPELPYPTQAMSPREVEAIEAQQGRHTQHRDAVIAQAIREGKFPRERASSYRQMWQTNPVQTEGLIASLGSVSQTSDGAARSAATDDSYPTEWLKQATERAAGPVHIESD